MMKNIILIISLVYIANFCIAQNECKTDLGIINDTAYHKNDTRPYTGSYYEFFPGELKVRGEYKNGLKEGEFLYFSDYMDGYDRFYDSIVNFSNGLKDGATIKYLKNRDYISSIENYELGFKHGSSYYWSRSGQITKVLKFRNDTLTKEQNFEIDSNLVGIDFIISDEFEGEIDKLKYSDGDTVEIKIVGFSVSMHPVDSTPVWDYKILDDFKVKSFSWSGTAIKDLTTHEHLDVSRAISKSSYFTKLMINYTFKWYSKEFAIIELICVDRNGFEYPLPPRYFKIKNYDK